MDEIVGRKRILSEEKIDSPTSPTKLLVNLTLQKINSQNVDWNKQIDIEKYLFDNKQVIAEKLNREASDSTQCSSIKVSKKTSVDGNYKMTLQIDKEETNEEKVKQPDSPDPDSSILKKSVSKAQETDEKNYEKSPTFFDSKPKKTTLKRTLSNPEFNYESPKEFDQKDNVVSKKEQLKESISHNIRVLSRKGEYTELFFYFFEFFLKRRLMKIKFKRA